jgi:hypothetical protein
LLEGMRRSGRSRAHFDVHGGGFIVTGPDEATVATGMQRARRRIGFYGSTRTYLPILALHGLQDLGLKLHRMSVEGRWESMEAEVPDDVVHIFAACGTYSEIAGAVARRFGGVADSIDLQFPAGTPTELQRELLTDIRRHELAGVMPWPSRLFASILSNCPRKRSRCAARCVTSSKSISI